jgi:inosine-uridine nucleoside N-ribohydrolase
VHDVTAVVYLCAPEVFTVKPAHVQVDLSHGPCYGRTVCDLVHRLGNQENARVGTGLDLDRFWDIVEEALRRY